MRKEGEKSPFLYLSDPVTTFKLPGFRLDAAFKSISASGWHHD